MKKYLFLFVLLLICGCNKKPSDVPELFPCQVVVMNGTVPDAIAILQKRFGSPESEAYMVEELERILIGNQIYDLRTQAGMTQVVLARKVGTKAAEIDRLESADYEGADYEGHPLPVLRKIAAVFGMRIELNFVPINDGSGGLLSPPRVGNCPVTASISRCTPSLPIDVAAKGC